MIADVAAWVKRVVLKFEFLCPLPRSLPLSGALFGAMIHRRDAAGAEVKRRKTESTGHYSALAQRRLLAYSAGLVLECAR